jgi:hypothetical protein
MAFSLRSLLAAVACVGLVVVGMIYATKLWVAGINGIFLLACSFSAGLIIYGTGTRRPFAIGFLAFGIPYFALANRDFDTGPGQYLLTHYGIQSLYPHISRVSEVPTDENSGFYTDPAIALKEARSKGISKFYRRGVGVVIQTVTPLQADFVQLGHSYCAILAGIVGGLIVSALQRQRDRAPYRLPDGKAGATGGEARNTESSNENSPQ